MAVIQRARFKTRKAAGRQSLVKASKSRLKIYVRPLYIQLKRNFMEIKHNHADINGLKMHFVTAGTGPAVLFCHGFPEIWYCWRAQINALASAGFSVIAPDMRGFGETEAPQACDQFTSVDVVGDMVALLDHLGIPTAAIVGHDWGATIAWGAALLRPDRFTAVAGLSVPYTPRGPDSLPGMLKRGAPANFYMLYFLEPGIAEAELDGDPRTFLRRVFYSNSGDLPADLEPVMLVADTGRLTDSLLEPDKPIPWLTETDLDVYTDAYVRSGFRGPLNTYRSLHRSWELTAAWDDRKIDIPALYIGGSRDIVLTFPGMREALDNFKSFAPLAEPPIVIEGIGHWVQYEAPEKVNQELNAFLKKAL